MCVVYARLRAHILVRTQLWGTRKKTRAHILVNHVYGYSNYWFLSVYWKDF